MAKKDAHKHIDFQGKEPQIKAVFLEESNLHITDFQLWQEFQRGSETAFSSMYEKYASMLYSYGLKLVYDKELVKDSIQDLFIELWDAKKRLSQVHSIKAYMFKALRRKLISMASKERGIFDKNQDLSKIDVGISSTEFSLIEKQRFDAKRAALRYALNVLSAKQKEIIHLKFYGRLSYAEIGEIMSLDKKGTYNLMARTIKILKQNLISVVFLIYLLSMG